MLIVDKKFSNKLISILFESQYNFFVKSLIRSLTSVPSDLSVALDQSRWKDELVLMKYYYDIKNNRSMAACLAPIIIINKDIEKMMDVLEDIYKIMYGNNNINVKSISIYAILIYTLNLDMKSNLISYKRNIFDQSEIIEFQREKIKLLMMDEEEILNYTLLHLYNEGNEEMRTKDYNLINKFRDIVKEKLTNNILCTLEYNDSINILSDYLLNLRNMKIIRKVYDKKVNPLDLINMEINNEYMFPLLGNIKIVDKYLNDDILFIEAHSKSEIYKFRLKKVK